MALQNYAIEPMKTFLDGQYSIPNYQREYSWEENEIQDFLNDLEDTCANPSTIHFFGQIVVHNDEDSQTKFIIDGQQRTITSMIFVHSLQLLYENLYFTTQYHPASKKEVLLSNYVGEYSDEEKSLHLILSEADNPYFIQTSVYKGYKQDKIEMRGDRAEMSDFPLYLNMVAGGLDRRDQTIGGFSFVVKIYALPVVEIIG